jgi:hypothetical protein
MRNEIAVIAVVVALFAGAAVGLVSSSPGGHTSTVSTTTTTVTTTVGQFCSSPSSLPVLPSSEGPGYSWSVNYTGRWNATAIGITGNGSVRLDQCYTSDRLGYVYVPDWSPTSGTTLTVTAHKMDGSNTLLSLAMNGELKNTTAPYGAVTVEAYTP